MLAKAELKLETGETIHLQFGMAAHRRFTRLFAPVEDRLNKMVGSEEQKIAELNLCIIIITLLAGYECFKVNNGDFETLEQEFCEKYLSEKYPNLKSDDPEYKRKSDERLFMVASRWVDLSGGVDGEQVVKAIQTWNFFKGEQKEETPPKKQTPKKRSVGTKSKVSQ